MKDSSASGTSSVLWWILWILLTVLSFFASCFFWTPFIAERFGSIREPSVPLIWVAAVFGTWMVLLVPLIIVMYLRVDKAYEDARLRREAALEKAAQSPPPFRWISVDPKERSLSGELGKKLKSLKPILKRSHLVNALLADGRRIEYVFVRDHRDVIGIYDREKLDFRIRDIVDLEAVDPRNLKDLKADRWLRLDGA